MDKNTITGLVIIFLILIGFSYFTRPSEEQMKAIQRQQDSIAQVERQRMELATRQQEMNQVASPSVLKDSTFLQDSLDNKTITLENDKIKLHITTRGGRISFVELKEYRTHDSLPLILWRNDESKLGLNFYARNQQINTEKFLFTPGTTETTLYAKDKEQVLSMRLYADNARTQYIEYIYKLAPDSYMTDFDIVTHNMENVIAYNSSFLTLYWGVNMPQLEKSKDFENRYTGVYYKFFEDDVENMSLTSDEEETLPTKVQWIDFKQQFFSSILITETPFSDVSLTSKISQKAGYLKDAYAEIPLPYNGKTDEQYHLILADTAYHNPEGSKGDLSHLAYYKVDSLRMGQINVAGSGASLILTPPPPGAVRTGTRPRRKVCRR